MLWLSRGNRANIWGWEAMPRPGTPCEAKRSTGVMQRRA